MIMMIMMKTRPYSIYLYGKIVKIKHLQNKKKTYYI